jgi:lipopolysaccharide export system permease protein
LLIDRYIAREVVKPLVAISGILLFIFVGYSSGRYLSYAVNGLLQVETLASFILLKAAIAMEVLLPVALYLSIVLGLGRLDVDYELIAMHSCGIGLNRVFRVVLGITVLMAMLVALMSMYGRPLAYEMSYWIRAQAEAEIDLDKLEAGNFYDSQRRERTIFVEDIEKKSKRLERVFVRSERDGIVRIIYAHTGDQQFDPASGKRSLVLSDVRVYEITRDTPKTKALGKFGQLSVQLEDPDPITVGYKRKAAATLDLARSTVPADIAEYQWRLSTPISTILLGMLAVVISRTRWLLSRYAKAVAAVVVYAVYYNTTAMAKSWVHTGVVAALPGIWWAQALAGTLLLTVLLYPRWIRERRTRLNRANGVSA